MRTTLTLDDDLAVILKRLADESGRPFKVVVNDAIRAGLREPFPEAEVRIPQPRPMGLLIDPVHAIDILDAIEDEKLFASMHGPGASTESDDRP